eukprot:CAMPEP_0113480660 /NCGR_PEP_ID=MMETSP0014_2-20120614/21994_1 /TAXON_ID=2857 /ORGANISM="Nitzschia sp." /LENGTH=228 /DNA_ID=CAMNT_0000374105 /DNA_START=296 /DNA_END=978 /DNA_ORIENTATION=+ /assembly_acc=CAM_ASM_000159
MNQGNSGPMSGGTSPMPAPNPAAASAANNSNNNNAPAGLSYDISSFADPLQAQALQLTASAGLTSLLGQQQQQQQQQQQIQAPGAAAMQSPLHNNAQGLQPIAPAGTAPAGGGTPTAPLGHHHHHHHHRHAPNAAHHLSAFLTPGALATAAAAGHQQQGVPAPVATTAGGATHPGLMFSNPAATAAAAAAGATPGTTPGNPNANGAAAIALIMQQLQHAGVTASPLLL